MPELDKDNLKVIRLDKGNIKYNYKVYKIIDKLVLTIHNI